MLFTADFETTTDPDDCRVWACGISSIDDRHDFYCGNNIEFFIRFCRQNIGSTFYFHNLKFDAEFIMCWLFENGFAHIKERNKLIKNSFTTLISDKGQFYSMEICFKNDKENKIKETVTIYDSLKILPFSVAQVAKGFNLDILKLDLDYHKTREKGHELTTEEIKYLKNDVEIMSRALLTLFEEDLRKMTQGSNALHDYKKIIGKKKFNKYFPVPLYDFDIRQSYKGGFTYCDPRKQGQDVGEGIVLDVNSLYPSVMYNEEMPYGEGIFFDGQYEYDEIYNLHIQMFTCEFDIKENHIPSIQLKNNLAFIPTAYLSSSNGEEVTLCLTSVDLNLFFDHYNVYNITYHSGWKFKGVKGLFKEYIDKWNAVKVESTLNGNEAMRTLAKLMLNSLYGKFALNPNVQSKLPVYSDGMIKYCLGEKETREPIYIPVGTFITSYARYKTISSAQKVYDRFLYADTDSLHLTGTEIPPELEVDPVKLGAWKHESTFTRARFVRQKTYIEEIDGRLSITCAGMPSRCYEHVTWENFISGTSFEGKLQFKRVKGGVILKDIDFTLKG